MSWKDTNISNPGTSVKYGADDMELVSRLLNGQAAGIPAVTIKSTNKWGFWDNVLFIRNQSDTKSTTIRGQSNNPATNIDLTLPPSTVNDILAGVTTQNQFTAKQEMQGGIYFKDMVEPTTPATGFLHLYTELGHLKRKNALGQVTDLDAIANGVPANFPDLSIKLLNPAATFSTTLKHAAVTANRQLNYPLITGTDTLAALTLGQTFSNKIFDASCDISAAIGTGYLKNTIDNDIGDHYLDIGDIAVPANPSAGTRRLFLNSSTGQLSVRTSAGTTLSLEAAAGGGDNVSVNGTAATDADFDDATPAAVSTGVNVKWQKDASTPNNISGYIVAAGAAVSGIVTSGAQTFGGAKTFNAVTTLNGIDVAQVAKTANYTMTATDYVVRCDASAGAFTITLPAAATAGGGAIYKIIRTDITSTAAGTLLTVDANASETIDGLLTWKLATGEYLTIMSDGTNWVSLDHTSPNFDAYSFDRSVSDDRRYVGGISGRGSITTSTSNPAANTLWALPFAVSKVTKFDIISFNITTAQASQNARAGIYFDTGNQYPGALIFDTNSISTGTTGIKETTITAGLQTFQPGLYWLAWETSATTCNIRCLGSAPNGIVGTGASIPTGEMAYGYSVAHTYGALPNPYTLAGVVILTSTPSATVPVPAIGLRAV